MKSVAVLGPRLVAGATIICAVALFFLPAPTGADPRAMQGAALVVFAIGLYATAVIPEFLTSLAFFLFAMLLAVAPAGVVFAGFGSTALWLVIGGLVIGIAVRHTGLGARLAAAMTGWFGQSYAGLVTGVVLIGIMLSFVMPSTMGRVVLLSPIIVALADRVGFEPGSAGRNGLVLAMVLGTWMPSNGILPASVPNLVMAGAIETLYDITLTYGSYLLLHFPVTGIVKAIAIVGSVLLLFPDRPLARTEDAEPLPPLSKDARILSAILLAALALWATDFLHGISPAWVALGAAIICLLPPVGLVPIERFNAEFNLTSVLHVAGVLGIGAVIADTGFGDVLGELLLQGVPFEPGADGFNFAVLAAVTTGAGMAATVTGVPAVISPLADDIAVATGLPLITVIMTQVIGYSTLVLPYQSPPFIVALRLGGVGLKAATRLTLFLTAITFVIVLPINFLWWRLLGYFG